MQSPGSPLCGVLTVRRSATLAPWSAKGCGCALRGRWHACRPDGRSPAEAAMAKVEPRTIATATWLALSLCTF